MIISSEIETQRLVNNSHGVPIRRYSNKQHPV